MSAQPAARAKLHTSQPPTFHHRCSLIFSLPDQGTTLQDHHRGVRDIASRASRPPSQPRSWDLDAQWTNLLIKTAPISIDTKFDVYWDYENEADEKSAVLVLDKINDDCWTQCKVISGYEAKIACE
jgi:hypothetical protein